MGRLQRGNLLLYSIDGRGISLIRSVRIPAVYVLSVSVSFIYDRFGRYVTQTYGSVVCPEIMASVSARLFARILSVKTVLA